MATVLGHQGYDAAAHNS